MNIKNICQNLSQLKHQTLQGAAINEKNFKEIMDYLIGEDLAAKDDDSYKITCKGEEYLGKCELWSNEIYYTHLLSIKEKPGTFDIDGFKPSLEAQLLHNNLVEKKENILHITETGKEFIKNHEELKK